MYERSPVRDTIWVPVVLSTVSTPGGTAPAGKSTHSDCIYSCAYLLGPTRSSTVRPRSRAPSVPVDLVPQVVVRPTSPSTFSTVLGSPKEPFHLCESLK